MKSERSLVSVVDDNESVLDLQPEVKRQGRDVPIIFITAQGDKSLLPLLTSAGRRRACARTRTG